MARKRAPVPPLEWAAAAFGLLVLAALLAIIGRGAMEAGKDSVPLLTAAAERVVATPSGHVVDIVVVNRGSATAASVQVEGAVGAETSIASIEYVPGESRAKAGLIFSADPRTRGLKLRVTAYELP